MSDTFEFDDKNHAERFVGTLHDPGATTGHVLTVQADKSIAAQPGGGGGSGVQVVTVPVSSAQILDLAGTPVTLVAGVPGQAIVPNAVSIVYVAGATPYTDNGGGMSLYPGGWTGITFAGFLDQAASQLFSPGFMSTQQGLVSVYDGDDLVLLTNSPNVTDGDGTLLVTLSYFLAPTA